MKLSKDYDVFASGHKLFLANIENGDLFEINDVVYDLVNACQFVDSVEELCAVIYAKYKNEDADYSKEDLKEFVDDMLRSGILEK